MVKGTGARKSLGPLPRPTKKSKPASKPIETFFHARSAVQGLLEESASCSPSHADEPTPVAVRVAGGGPLSRAPGTSLPSVAGGGHQLKTAVLKSLNRRLVQSTLQTPFASGAGCLTSAAASCDAARGDEDFVLYSSQTYERVLSQQVLCDAATTHNQEPEASTQDIPTQTQFLPEPSQLRYPSQSLAAQQALALQPSGSGHGIGEEAPRRVSNASTCSARTTPGMRTEDEAAAGVGTLRDPPSRLFPVFRSRRERKVLHIIRHGESEYNAACNGPTWADPEIYDAPLTLKGKQQAMELRDQLAGMDLPPDVLWVTSPLTRAIQTLTLACPALQSGGSRPKVVVRSEISEHLWTTGDVGHPPSVLAQRWPDLAEQFAELPEVWWHCEPGKPNCALSGILGKTEPKANLQKRIGDFRRWLDSRPEKVIVAVGHSMYWKSFLRSLGHSEVRTLHNCELMTLRV